MNLYWPCLIVGAVSLWAAVVMPTPFDEPEQAVLGSEVRADVMANICFPDGVYVQAAHQYCQKFKEDLFEHLNRREREIAEKCINDGVKVSKCVRMDK